MNEYGGNGIAMALLCGLLIIGVCVIAVVWIGGQVGEAVQDARIALSAHQTERAQARADEAQARVDRAAERTDAARERNVHTETMYMLWTTALAGFASHNEPWLIVVAVVAALAIGAGGIRWLDRQWAPVESRTSERRVD